METSLIDSLGKTNEQTIEAARLSAGEYFGPLPGSCTGPLWLSKISSSLVGETITA